MWRKEKPRQASRYDMAILINPDEKLPPSNESAIKKFIRIGHKMGIEIDLLGRRDLRKLSEYDMLFIRETTAINHHTFQFARRAETDGLVVIDDPQSIIRCTNKVFMADLFAAKNIAQSAPAHRDDGHALRNQRRTRPLVLKSDGSFSRRRQSRKRAALPAAARIVRQSACCWFFHRFDWRIGV